MGGRSQSPFSHRGLSFQVRVTRLWVPRPVASSLNVQHTGRNPSLDQVGLLPGSPVAPQPRVSLLRDLGTRVASPS